MGYQRIRFSRRHLSNKRDALSPIRLHHQLSPNLTIMLGVAGVVLSTSAFAGNVTWVGNGTNNYWDNSSNWSPSTPNGTDNVINSTGATIDVENGGTFGTFVTNGELDLTGGSFTGGEKNSTLQVNGLLNIEGGTLQGVDVLAPTGGQLITFHSNASNTLINDTFEAGTKLDFASQLFAMSFVEGITNFNGTTSLASPAIINIQTTASNGVSVLTNNGTIQGAGTILGNQGLVNNNTINADTNNQTLLLEPSSITNSGILEATDGGLLNLNSTTTSSGMITASGNGSKVDINGTLTDSGAITANGSGSEIQLEGTLTGNGDHLNAENGGLLLVNGSTISGSVNVNTGSLSFADNSNNDLLNATITGNLDFVSQLSATSYVEGTTTFKGTTFMAPDCAIGIQTTASNGASTLTNNGAIQGAGIIFGNQSLENNNTINANINSQTLMIEPASITSSGIMEATNGGELNINSNFTNSGSISAIGAGTQVILGGTGTNTGTISASGNGSQVALIGALTDSGTILATGLGSEVLVEASLNGNSDNLYASNGGLILAKAATISGTINVKSGSLSFGSFGNNLLNATLNGSLDFATQSNAFSDVSGATSFNGTTSMAPGSDIEIQLTSTNGQSSLTNNGTIQGAGSVNGDQGLVNNGAISANMNGQTLLIDPLSVTNSRTLEAIDGGVLNLNSTITNSGNITAEGAGSQVSVSGALTDNGTITSNGSGSEVLLEGTLTGNGDSLNAASGGVLLANGSMVSGTVNVNTGSLSFANNTLNKLLNATVNGTLDFASQTNAFSYVEGATFFNGTTSMAAGSAIAIFNTSSGDGSTLTNNGTIQGAGTIYGNQGLVNNSIINANNSGQTLLLDSSGVTNVGTLEATNGGTLTVQTPGVVGGNVNASASGTVNLPNGIAQTSGVSTIDGTLNSPGANFALGGGTLKGTGTLNLSLNQTGGIFNPGSDPGSMSITGNYAITGGTYQLDISSLTNFDLLNVSGSADISGGTLSLDFLNGYRPTQNNMYQFLLANSYIGNNAFSSYNSNINGLGFSYSNGQVTIGNVPPPAVPEASSVLALLGMLGMGGAGCLSRKRKPALS